MKIGIDTNQNSQGQTADIFHADIWVQIKVFFAHAIFARKQPWSLPEYANDKRHTKVRAMRVNNIASATSFAVLLPLSAMFVNNAHADIKDELKACFNKSDLKESQKCLTELRAVDEINRPLPGDARTLVILAVKTHDSEAVEKHGRDIRRVIDANLEPSYFTAGSGFHAGGDRTTTAMLYEAQVFQNFNWLKRSFARGGDVDGRMDFWLDLPIRIGVRQLSVSSYPVRTPTFNPGLRLFVAKNEGENVEEGARYYSIGLHHYSNGQEGDAPTNASIPNLRNGSFNTNYVEAAAYSNWKYPCECWSRLTFRQHLYGTWDPLQKNQYPKRQISLELRSGILETDAFKADLRWTGNLGLGYGYVVRPGVEQIRGDEFTTIPGTKAGFADKLHNTFELSVKPTWSGALAWYLRYDIGYDYYNINFQNRINRLQIGFVAR